jgi:hypothetical protein
MNARHLFFSSLVLFATTAARADNVDDFDAGTAVVLEAATVDTGNGPRTSAGSGRIAKASDTLDFALHASDLGVELPLVVHFRGSRLSARRIEYEVGETYAPPVELGGGLRVTGLSGRLTMRVVALPGREAADPGNVRLILAAPTTVVAHTSAGDVSIQIASLAVQGGVAQPPLVVFRDPNADPICSDRVPTYRDLEVSLVGAAQASGAVVALTRPFHTAVGLPPAVVVRARRTSAIVRLRIEPGFVGRVPLVAAAGGVARSLDVDVRPAGECR